MVDITDVEMEEPPTAAPSAAAPAAASSSLETKPSEERLFDAEEIEAVAATLKRPTAQMHLTALAKKLRKESEALKRLEDSNQRLEGDQAQIGSGPSVAATNGTTSRAVTVVEPTKIPNVTVTSPSFMYTPIDKFAFDAGKYNAPFVTLYVDLPGVGMIPKEQITCEFHASKFDLIVRDLRGKSYRLMKDHLEKDIVADKSKYVVKADKIIVKLAKVKGEYGSYDYWSKLTDPKRGSKEKNDNPASGIMDLMKEMYESGDDKMKKMIGETMLKQRTGELDAMGGMGGMGDLGGMKNKDLGLGDLGSGLDDDDDLDLDDDDDDV